MFVSKSNAEIDRVLSDKVYPQDIQKILSIVGERALEELNREFIVLTPRLRRIWTFIETYAEEKNPVRSTSQLVI